MGLLVHQWVSRRIQIEFETVQPSTCLYAHLCILGFHLCREISSQTTLVVPTEFFLEQGCVNKGEEAAAQSTYQGGKIGAVRSADRIYSVESWHLALRGLVPHWELHLTALERLFPFGKMLTQRQRLCQAVFFCSEAGHQ